MKTNTMITTTNYLHTIDELLNAAAAANSEWQNFDKQLAASVAWSLSSRYQYFFSELLLVDYPKNPRRARSHDESAERTERLEGICDETLGLLSVLAARASAEMLPTAGRYFPATPDRWPTLHLSSGNRYDPAMRSQRWRKRIPEPAFGLRPWLMYQTATGQVHGRSRTGARRRCRRVRISHGYSLVLVVSS